jgi:hypothetical protein
MELNSQWLYHASIQITPTAYSYAYHHGMSHPPLTPPGELLIPCLFWKNKAFEQNKVEINMQ